MLEYLTWFKQSGFLIAQKRMIYIDPWDIGDGNPPADFIFVTHAHYDHFDKEAIEKLRTAATIVVAPKDVAGEIEGAHAITPGIDEELEGLRFHTVPAYNIWKRFHPKQNGWVGYILELPDGTLYHAGDTDFIQEMREIKTDVALLPVGGTYTMDSKEAAQAALAINPKIAVPMHYGFAAGARGDGERFINAIAPIHGVLMEPKTPFPV